MASGMWVVMAIPAIIAFIFGAWVLYSVMVDVSERDQPAFTVVGPDRVRANIEPRD